MATRRQTPIFDEVVRLTHIYLGSAADKFLVRQIENHLHKPAAQLTRADLKSLLDWIRAVAALMNEDTETIEEYIVALENLTEAPYQPQHLNQK